MMSAQAHSSRPLIRTWGDEEQRACVGNWSAYGDLRLEAATFAVGQLDALLSCHPPLSF
jgi:hypothetical protein